MVKEFAGDREAANWASSSLREAGMPWGIPSVAEAAAEAEEEAEAVVAYRGGIIVEFFSHRKYSK